MTALIAASVGSSAGTAPLNVIYGMNGHDKIAATPAADVIYTKSGNDIVTGLGSGDAVYASSGNDEVSFHAPERDEHLSRQP